jgi:hypothetical protein
MDIIEFVAERKILEAIDEGLFDDLPRVGRIDCSLRGEAFIARWWREKIAREEARAGGRMIAGERLPS